MADDTDDCDERLLVDGVVVLAGGVSFKDFSDFSAGCFFLELELLLLLLVVVVSESLDVDEVVPPLLRLLDGVVVVGGVGFVGFLDFNLIRARVY